MKIWTLIENTACREDLCAEHGLSLYIETRAHKILFDAGQSDSFADNAERLGVRLSQVDICILSHGHYDHGGGLMRFLEVNDHASVYMHRDAFSMHYNGDRYIGLDERLRGNGRIVFTDDALRIDGELEIVSGNGRNLLYPGSGQGLTVRRGGVVCPDDFPDEQYLIIHENGRRTAVSGCSHKGVLNIMDWLEPDVLIGGFHFSKLDPEGEGREALEEAARILMEHGALYYTGHCTGTPQYDFLKERMGDCLQPITGGSVITI